MTFSSISMADHKHPSVTGFVSWNTVPRDFSFLGTKAGNQVFMQIILMGLAGLGGKGKTQHRLPELTRTGVLREVPL